MINRYKELNALSMMPDNDGRFVLYADMLELLERFVNLAGEAGADSELLIKLIEGMQNEKSSVN